MSAPRPYNAATDTRSGTNSFRRGKCSSTWCRQPATKEYTTKGGQTRYMCADHERELVEIEPADGYAAAGAGDGVYHDAPFLKKFGG